MSITKARATPYDKTKTDVRMKGMMSFKESSVAEPTSPKVNVRRLDSRDTEVVKSQLNFNLDSDDDLKEWAIQKIKDPDWRWRGIKIDGIDIAKSRVYYHKDGQLKAMVLKQFIDALRQDLKFEIGKEKLSGNSITREETIKLIEQDIQNERPFMGQKILYIDYTNNQVVLEGHNSYGFNDFEPLDSFLDKYMENRKYGYMDSDTTVQVSEEETRKNNISDMAEAFRQALGIKPPRVESYAPLKETRQIGGLATELMGRGDPYTWTVEELSSVYKTGVVSNPTTKVSGNLNNTFIPPTVEPKIVRNSPGPTILQYDNQM